MARPIASISGAMTTINMPQEDRRTDEEPWWFVRRSLLATFVIATLILVAIFTPTPLNEWVFGDGSAIVLTGQ